MKRPTFILALVIPSAGLGAAAATLTIRAGQEDLPHHRAPAVTVQARAANVRFPLPVGFDAEDQLHTLVMEHLALAPGNNGRFLRMSIVINCGADAELAAALATEQGDRIIEAISEVIETRRGDELLRPAAKAQLREQLVLLISRLLQTQSVKDVYYAEFLIT